ncbi:Gfo/Idh/MocA family protein [Sphingobacterium psychroaquaticum]|uniref:Oxidoreductase family, NAD-binding Rossmann fold n=1 Tax=Sphingobacterium psychroaquaticum TaxID=561061 RepID=A0A1X7KSL9_9SPHI|nr:Gfo/Idh/MocA family oxidoreductase [Sphingobacterium psychroaquaticum]QBQ40634.1 Gfo/Idh/MocA family oxidoreductase [Sphingobacterium psychroaquaticum]SMG44575.1 Oxidoreductase family, NAD-binding Rossmann fold [Sphingobacterium psychroaquaticum]
MDRRNFIKNSATVAGFTIVSSNVLGKTLGHVAPSDKLNIAGIGVGGMGRRNLANMNTENIVALCDVDWKYAKKTFNDYPKAKQFKDWREMFDQMGNSIDAVMVATPDHTHALVSAHAMTLGKHCYTQKPLTHSVYESRLLTNLAKKHKVATQMGNQGNSFDWCRQIAEWIQSDAIGEVYEVHCWTDRPIWPQGLMKPKDAMPVPDTLAWDLFLGPAENRPYNSVYTPWNWRGWWDFGTGALGDMACHIMDPIYWALDLKYPTKVNGSSTLSNLYSPPHAQMVQYTFPARPKKGKVNMPEVKVHWYDGGLVPERPQELAPGQMMGDENGGIIFVGKKGKIMTGCYGMNATLLPVTEMNHFAQPKPWIPRVKGGNGDIWNTNAHEQDWIRAAKESPSSRKEASSNFGFSGPFNEMVVMGVLAVRLQALHRDLLWDGERMEFTNISAADKLKIVSVDEFSVVDGDPRFNRQYVELNAKDAASEWIKHRYHNGFSLPDMPKF